MSKNKTIVLGGGIAGVSAAWHLKKCDEDVLCYEASDKPGGLLSNFEIEGFRFDNAVHLSFTNDEYVRSIFDKTDYNTLSPEAYCIDRHYWLKHPVQNNLHPLPLAEKIKHLKGIIDRPDQEPKDYGEWLDHQYGKSISQTYPRSYTEKYWGLDASALSTSWIGSRMRRSDIDEVLGGALEPRSENDYYAKEMRYPKYGGYYAFIAELAQQVGVECNMRASKINIDDKVVHFENGQSVYFNKLISSLPLPVITELIQDVPGTVLAAAESLLWTTVDLVSVGFDRPDVPPHLWFYLYGKEHLAARAYSPSLKSAQNAPPSKSSLQFEIYNLSTSDAPNVEMLKENVTNSLISTGLCKPADILFVHHKRLSFGNVVFDHGMEQRRQIVLDFLRDNDIRTCGRFGEWDYFWSDQSLLSGKRVAESLL